MPKRDFPLRQSQDYRIDSTSKIWAPIFVFKIEYFRFLQVYTETLNSTNIKAENASENDIMGFVNDKIMLFRIKKDDLKCQIV